VLEWEPFSEVAWRDNRTAVFISGNEQIGPVMVMLDRQTGAVMTKTLDLPGAPVTLAPNASRVILAVEPRATQKSRRRMPRSPFTIPINRAPFQRVGPAKFDAERQIVKLAEERVTLVSLDLNTGQVTELVALPEGSGIISPPAWTPDGSKLGIVRMALPSFSRTGELLSTAFTQDGLGNLPPDKNPFFQSNVVDTFDFGRKQYRPEALKAREGNGYTFGRVGWSTNGQTLMAQVWRPSQLQGRRYPIYQFADRSAVRFYDSKLQLIKTLDRPEIEAPYTSLPVFASPDEVIFDAPLGLSYRLYYYNHVSGEFRQLPTPEGTYYQVRTTRLSRRIIYNFSSFQNPYEVYRIGWDGNNLKALTSLNAEAAKTNQVRADQVSFTMRSGARRTGYIVQPAGAAFPPRDARMIVWQQGGPGGTITNEWGSNVEQPFNLLPNFGLPLLILPLPGREGWGPDFYNALADGRNFGSIDVDEGVEAVQQMIARGYTGRNKVGITGCSYGGYFTSQSITRHPHVYAAANSQCSLLDLFAEWQFGFTGFLSYLEGRAPTGDPEEYTRDSPVYNAVRVRTPLLLFDGTQDFLPYSISGNFHDQVAAGGWPADFLVWRDEGHGLRMPNSQFGAGQAQIHWFRRYLAESGRR
jgi:dipeptidyl aminopeptidase/acylaminoacyl peptidase